MRKLKHLPIEQWPVDDQEGFDRAFQAGDIFDGSRGPGAHHSSGWRRMITTSYRRWLGFLSENYPADLLKPPTKRITPERVRAFVEHLEAEVRPTTVAMSVAHLYAAARLIAPELDWRWLASIRTRLAARAKPDDRFDRLVPGWHTLDFGIELMEEAKRLPKSKMADRQYRDGLMLVLLSLWNIRRRSFAALTVNRHVEFDQAGMNILLYPEDTKSNREESFRVPEAIVPYFTHYLKVVRPRIVGSRHHEGLWASNKGCPLTACRIYDIAYSRTLGKFGKAMGLHDFRRAAHTFLAIDAPSQIGLVPGMLQHVSLDTGERHYNLAKSVEASRRFAAHLEKTRAKLRPVRSKKES